MRFSEQSFLNKKKLSSIILLSCADLLFSQVCFFSQFSLNPILVTHYLKIFKVLNEAIYKL